MIRKVNPNSFAICICTYQRPHLLLSLIKDIALQTVQAQRIVVIDGSPETNQVREILQEQPTLSFIYIPSDHANISYQRYLGWKAAVTKGVEILVFLDDDIRVDQKDALEKLIAPLEGNEQLIGTTAPIIFPGSDNLRRDTPKKDWKSKIPLWRDAHLSGSITPVGVRLLPQECSEERIGIVKWAYGAVMAFEMKYLTADSFLEDSFALNHVGCGLGEDTLISHIASFKGDIGFVIQARFLHPNADKSRAYSRDAFPFGFATAYSRRLINDHYRQKPMLRDRLYLIGSYMFNNFINLKQLLTHWNKYQLQYIIGYFMGSIRGILQKPTAKHLTPGIHWFEDAEKALAKAEEIH